MGASGKIEVRCSEQDRAAWKAKADAAGLTLSELVRQSLGRVRTWTVKDRRAARERVLQLARIGNNLNQIARWANTHKSAADATEVIGALVSIERLLSETAETAAEVANAD